MKALFLRTDFLGSITVGGSFSHTKGFLDGLRALGHDYAVIASGPLSLGEGSRVYEIPYSDTFRNLPEVLSVAYNYRLIRRSKSIIRKERPDFLYHRHSEFNFASSVLARHFNIPLVLEFNGSEVWVKEHWGKVYLKSILQKAEDVQLLAADVIAVVSQVIKDDLVRKGFDGSKIIVNPNGVDTARFHPAVHGDEIVDRYKLHGKTVAGFVGTFGAWHGVEVLARSIKPTVMKNPRIHFLMIGDGNMRGEVERIIRDDGVGEYATLTGTVPNTLMPQYLAACDILLSPHVQNADGTRFFGSPTKLFEYMGMGKPIIASGVGQIADIIQDGRNGLLMTHRDHIDLAEKINALAEDQSLRAGLGREARRDAVEKFSWSRNAGRIIDAVESLGRPS